MGNLFTAQGHVGIYNNALGPHKMINFKTMDLPSFESHLQLPWQGQTSDCPVLRWPTGWMSPAPALDEFTSPTRLKNKTFSKQLAPVWRTATKPLRSDNARCVLPSLVGQPVLGQGLGKATWARPACRCTHCVQGRQVCSAMLKTPKKLMLKESKWPANGQEDAPGVLTKPRVELRNSHYRCQNPLP